MSGTAEGGKHARDTNIRQFGRDYYARIGRIGGQNGTTGGFYANRELARIAGAKGGRISKRGKYLPKNTTVVTVATSSLYPANPAPKKKWYQLWR